VRSNERYPGDQRSRGAAGPARPKSQKAKEPRIL
jgi:hypothetical protein